MRRSGCETLGLGLESVDQATLDALHKSQTVADIVAAIDAIHHNGIRVHGMFVLGADTDDRHTARATAEFAIAHDIDTIMLNVLTPAPGTQWFADMDAAGRIFDKRWDLYDGQHVMMTPLRMTPVELQAELMDAYRRFYSLRRWLGHIARGRWLTVRDHLWCWWFTRTWKRHPRNRRYLEELTARTAAAQQAAAASGHTAPGRAAEAWRG